MSRPRFRWPSGHDWINFTTATPAAMRLRRIMAVRDAALLQQWFCSERGRFWTMPDKSLPGVLSHYARLQHCGHACAFLGHAHERPAFVIECYDPAHDQIANHYQVEPGDLGLHLFVAAPVTRIPHFTRDVFRFALRFMFQRLRARRVVVEPDVDNLRIHTLNHSMGFRDAGRVTFPDKISMLSFCTRADFLTCHPKEPRT